MKRPIRGNAVRLSVRGPPERIGAFAEAMRGGVAGGGARRPQGPPLHLQRRHASARRLEFDLFQVPVPPMAAVSRLSVQHPGLCFTCHFENPNAGGGRMALRYKDGEVVDRRGRVMRRLLHLVA